MNKRLCLLFVLSLLMLPLGGCALQFGEVEATLPPGITQPEGSIVSTNPKVVEGRIKKLTDDDIVISVQGVDWKMELSDHAQYMVKRFNELDIPVKKGTFVMAYYEEEVDGEREVTRIEVVESN